VERGCWHVHIVPELGHHPLGHEVLRQVGALDLRLQLHHLSGAFLAPRLLLLEVDDEIRHGQLL